MKKKLYGLSLILIVIDQIIKYIVSDNIILNKEITIIDKFFYITHVHNDGAAFSILSGNIILLIAITIVAVVAIHLFFIKNKKLNNVEIILISMLIGGIIGNFIDRITLKYVVDYLEFIIFGYYFPVFNFADICIVLSIAGLVIRELKEDICKSLKLKKN